MVGKDMIVIWCNQHDSRVVLEERWTEIERANFGLH